jgi:hypothetical protein
MFKTGRGARTPVFPRDKCHTWWSCGYECHQRTEVGNDGDMCRSGRATNSHGNGDNNKPTIRRGVKRRVLRRATFKCEGTRIMKSGHAFPDARRMMNKSVRCTRRESKVDDGAEGWCTAVRFFNNSAYFEGLFCRVEASDRVSRHHHKARRPALH